MRHKIPPQFEYFCKTKKKAKELWTPTGSANERFKIVRKDCFENLSDYQIRILGYVKMVQRSKLYDCLIKEQFKIFPDENIDDELLAKLVSNVSVQFLPR